MGQENAVRLEAQLERQEGFRRFVYKDSLGYWTVGIGRCVDQNVSGSGLTLEEGRYLMRNDIAKAEASIGDILRDDPVRRAVLVNMTFQMGWGKVKGFKKMLAAIGRKDWETAAREGLDSLWARQTPGRAMEMMEQLRTGKWQR